MRQLDTRYGANTSPAAELLATYARAMSGEADLSTPAALMAEPTRASMLLALLDGSERPASELARIAGVSAPTASEHLARLTAGGLIEDRRCGRHRYFRLCNTEVAAAIEALARIAPSQPVNSLRSARAGRTLAYARTCYDHLAGQLGVAVAEALVARGTIEPLRSGEVGRIARSDDPLLQTLDFDIDGRARRPAVRGCLDWTQRRPHVAGRLGDAILTYLDDRRWIVRARGDRSVRLSEAGRDGLGDLFGIDLAELESAA